MEAWEERLLEDTRLFVRELGNHVPSEKYEEVVGRIYRLMHRTIKLFHQEGPARGGNPAGPSR